jgi:hypothetical protein
MIGARLILWPRSWGQAFAFHRFRDGSLSLQVRGVTFYVGTLGDGSHPFGVVDLRREPTILGLKVRH